MDVFSCGHEQSAANTQTYRKRRKQGIVTYTRCRHCYNESHRRSHYRNYVSSHGAGGDDMTEAQLDAMIAEQRPTMPDSNGHDKYVYPKQRWTVPIFRCDRRRNDKFIGDS